MILIHSRYLLFHKSVITLRERLMGFVFFGYPSIVAGLFSSAIILTFFKIKLQSLFLFLVLLHHRHRVPKGVERTRPRSSSTWRWNLKRDPACSVCRVTSSADPTVAVASKPAPHRQACLRVVLNWFVQVADMRTLSRHVPGGAPCCVALNLCVRVTFWRKYAFCYFRKHFLFPPS